MTDNPDLTPHERQVLRSAGFQIPAHGPQDTMTREDHLAWAKQRALEYVDAGDNTSALASMQSDMHKHSELRDHPGLDLGMMLALSANLASSKDMREWIEGFN